MVSDNELNVGQRIRERREQLGLSLREVAARSGLSLNAISRIERGDHSPTVASLHLIAGALGVSITEFFVTKAGQRIVYRKPAECSHDSSETPWIESLGDGLHNPQIEPFRVTVLPGQRPQLSITHAGQEFVYCLSGQVHYQIDERVYELEAGHSLLFEADQPHRFWNPTAAPAQLIFVFQAAAGYQRHLEPL